jgi:hypothetical protein
MAGVGAQSPDLESLWKAYEAAQRNYDNDHQLFSGRMNLFLVVQSALVAVGASSSAPGLVGRHELAVLSIVLCVAWFAVAVSSYRWIKTWRVNLIGIGGLIEARTGITLPSSLFARSGNFASAAGSSGTDRMWHKVSWYVRPTMITCLLPLLFLGSWIYIGWL